VIVPRLLLMLLLLLLGTAVNCYYAAINDAANCPPPLTVTSRGSCIATARCRRRRRAPLNSVNILVHLRHSGATAADRALSPPPHGPRSSPALTAVTVN